MLLSVSYAGTQQFLEDGNSKYYDFDIGSNKLGEMWPSMSGSGMVSSTLLKPTGVLSEFAITSKQQKETGKHCRWCAGWWNWWEERGWRWHTRFDQPGVVFAINIYWPRSQPNDREEQGRVRWNLPVLLCFWHGERESNFWTTSKFSSLCNLKCVFLSLLLLFSISPFFPPSPLYPHHPPLLSSFIHGSCCLYSLSSLLPLLPSSLLLLPSLPLLSLPLSPFLLPSCNQSLPHFFPLLIKYF